MLRCTLLLLIVVSTAFSQDWKHFTTLNSNLPSDLVYALEIAPDGTVWCGTGSGLAYLKGSSWTTFDTSNSPLPDPYITALAIDSSNTLWIGTGYAGVARLSNGAWTLYDSAHSGLPSNTIFDIAIGPDHTPWFATDDGVVNLKEGTWKNLKHNMIEPQSRSVAFDRNGVLWMGTYAPTDFRGYVEYMKGDSFSHTILSKLDIISTHATTMLAMDESTMFVGTGNGLARVVNGVWTIFHSQDSPLPANGIASLALISDTMIVGTASGVVEITEGSWNVLHPTVGGLPADVITDIALDKYGNRWFATMSSGIACYKMGGIVTHIQNKNAVPSPFELRQNYPNPFNPSTTIAFTLPAAGKATLKVYTLFGQEAAILFDGMAEAGVTYQQIFNASNLASGVYCARLTSRDNVQTKKMILMK
ncbi:MAG: two-component regulator propeller domain-containing protein [Bacteroidota bacterium]